MFSKVFGIGGFSSFSCSNACMWTPIPTYSLAYVLNSIIFVLNGRVLHVASSSGVFWSIIMAIVGGFSMMSVNVL